ncbi:MAG: aminopeptidase [Lachnospiraceae bacterium]|nr:aminopeptidase [Lachnospiraceae bacterium]
MTEDMEERFKLVTDRIREIRTACDIEDGEHFSEGALDYFFELSNLAIGILPVLKRTEKKETKKADLPDFVDEQKMFYDRFEPDSYEKNFLNPEYSAKRLGKKLGGILSAFYMDFTAIIPWSYEGRKEWITYYFELFDEIYTLFEDQERAVTAGEKYTDMDLFKAIRDSLHSFYQDYSEEFIADGIEGLVDPDRSFFTDILMKADLSEPRYLYFYGSKVGWNEIRLWEYLKDLSEEEIHSMAETYVKGYIDGFAITGRDISIKKSVSIEFPIGLERVMREAVLLFEDAGLSVTLQRDGLLSCQRRGSRRNLYTNSMNMQAYYDHKDDKGYYYDKAYVGRKLEVVKTVYEKNRKLAHEYGGPAVVETFGEEKFTPINKKAADPFTKAQRKAYEELSVYDMSEQGQIVNEYIPGDERSFTIISYPLPSIGEKFRDIFRETVLVNTLDSDHYRTMQQHMIDLLDQGYAVHVSGRNGNRTDITVALHPLTDPSKETIFENCAADVNIPVGEVFTSPQLEGTNGILNVGHVYLEGYSFQNLTLTFENGMVVEASCDNFDSEEENKNLIDDHILFHHKTLPLGEFAIGTNTTAYRMGRKFHIEEALPILIAEKTGPHFAVGDTCYSHAEDVPMHNPDGKEVVARDNSIVRAFRETDPSKAYFNCHTDITIPYDELGAITVLKKDGTETDIIRDGRFVVPGTEELNDPLDEMA